MNERSSRLGNSSLDSNRGPKVNTRSEGVIKWHSQGLDLLFNDNTQSVLSDRGLGREVLSPSTLKSELKVFVSEPKAHTGKATANTRITTNSFNLHQRGVTLEDKSGREVLSPAPPKVASEIHNETWSPTRARHRRAQPRSTGSSLEPNFTPPSIVPLNAASTTPIRPNASRQLNTTIDIPPGPAPSLSASLSPSPSASLSSSVSPSHSSPLSLSHSHPQKDHSHLPPLSWKRSPTPVASPMSDNSSDISELDTPLITSTSTPKLPQVQYKHVWNDVISEAEELQPQDDLSSSPPLPVNTSTVSPVLDETTLLTLTVLRQQHPRIEDTLAHRLTLLKTASHLFTRNGGIPSGIPFAIEYILTCGDVGALVDIAKASFSIDEAGEDVGERGELDAADYSWMSAWLSAVPLMVTSTHPHHVLVGIKVMSIIVSVLEQWVDTAIGIARSLGSDAIPDELRDQCQKYNSACQKLLPLMDGIERKGRVGVVVNDVRQQLNAFISRPLP